MPDTVAEPHVGTLYAMMMIIIIIIIMRHLDRAKRTDKYYLDLKAREIVGRQD